MSPFCHYGCLKCAEKGSIVQMFCVYKWDSELEIYMLLCMGNMSVASRGRGSWTLFMEIPACVLPCFPGLPAVPGQCGAALPLSATSHFLLCGESLPPAFPGAETSVLHSQVSLPLTPAPGSVLPWGLGGKTVLISFGLRLFTPSPVRGPLSVQWVHVTRYKGGTPLLLEMALSVAESISTNWTWNSFQPFNVMFARVIQFFLHFEDLQLRTSVLLSNLRKHGKERHPLLVPPFSKMWCWAKYHARPRRCGISHPLLGIYTFAHMSTKLYTQINFLVKCNGNISS